MYESENYKKKDVPEISVYMQIWKIYPISLQ